MKQRKVAHLSHCQSPQCVVMCGEGVVTHPRVFPNLHEFFLLTQKKNSMKKSAIIKKPKILSVKLKLPQEL